MRVHDERLPDETFSEFVQTMPQCCVEIVLSTPEGVLLAKRSKDPVKYEWFWPGGRLYKGEHLEDAAHRIAAEELDIAVDIIERLGVHEHIWETSAEAGNPSRHTVNIVYLVEPTVDHFEIRLDDQHSAIRFVKTVDETYHEYVKEYFADHELAPGQ